MKKFILVLLLSVSIFFAGVGCTEHDPMEDMWTMNVWPSLNTTYNVGNPTHLYSGGYFYNIWVTNNGSFGNVSAGYYYGNGSTLTGVLTALPATGNFTNINVTNNATVGNTVTTKNLTITNVAVVGNVTSQALLTLASGNIAAGLAPLKFTAGPLLTVPVAGAMEFDGTGIYLTPTNHRRFISLASDSITSTVFANTTVETTLWNGTINANELKVNRVYNIKGCGLYTTHDANDKVTINLSVDGTVITGITTPAGLVTNKPWSFETYFTVRAVGASDVISSYGEIEAGSGESYSVNENVAVNTTSINYVTLRATWSDVSNNISLTQCWLQTQD